MKVKEFMDKTVDRMDQRISTLVDRCENLRAELKPAEAELQYLYAARNMLQKLEQCLDGIEAVRRDPGGRHPTEEEINNDVYLDDDILEIIPEE